MKKIHLIKKSPRNTNKTQRNKTRCKGNQPNRLTNVFPIYLNQKSNLLVWRLDLILSWAPVLRLPVYSECIGPIFLLVLFLPSNTDSLDVLHTYFGVPWKQGCVFKQFFHVQRDKENIVYGWEQGEGWVVGIRGQLCGTAELFHKEDDRLLGVDSGGRLHSTGDQWRWLHSFRCLYEHDASSTAQEAIRPLWRCEERQAGKEALRPQGELV